MSKLDSTRSRSNPCVDSSTCVVSFKGALVEGLKIDQVIDSSLLALPTASAWPVTQVVPEEKTGTNEIAKLVPSSADLTDDPTYIKNLREMVVSMTSLDASYVREPTTRGRRLLSVEELCRRAVWKYALSVVTHEETSASLAEKINSLVPRYSQNFLVSSDSVNNFRWVSSLGEFKPRIPPAHILHVIPKVVTQSKPNYLPPEIFNACTFILENVLNCYGKPHLATELEHAIVLVLRHKRLQRAPIDLVGSFKTLRNSAKFGHGLGEGARGEDQK